MEGLFDADLIRILLGSIPHLFHILPICFLRQILHTIPLPSLWRWLIALCLNCFTRTVVGSVWWWWRRLHAKQWMVLIGENAVCRHPASESDIRGSFSPYLSALNKYAVRHIFCVKCWVWKLRQVQGRMRCMGNLGATVYVGTKRNSSAKKLAFYSGVLLLFCVSFILR